MVDVCVQNTKGDWTGVWTSVLCDCITDAIPDDSELITENKYGSRHHGVGDEVVEVVIVTRREWDRLREQVEG